MPNNASPSAPGRGQSNVPPARNPEDAQRKYNAQGDYGTILSVDPVRMVAKVSTQKGGILEDVPFTGWVSPEGEGDFGIPVPGQSVGLDYSLGLPQIDKGHVSPSHVVPKNPEADLYSEQVNTWLSVTGTGLVFHKGKVGQATYRSQRPYDLLSGDRGFMAPGGAMVYVGRGGIAGLKVSDLCQIILNQIDDHMRLISRNFELMTDFGVLSVTNEKGKTKLKLLAAATAEAAWKGDYELVLSMGDGKAYVDIALYADSEKVWTFKVDPKGNQHSFHAEDVIGQVKGNRGEAVGGRRLLSVGKDDLEEIKEKKTIKVPKLHLGDEGGQKAVMGEDLVAYLKELVDFLQNKMVLQSPAGAVMTNALGGGPAVPKVPDLLSQVVDLVKEAK